MYRPYTVCNCDQHRLAEREKQVFNAFSNGAWTCFLLQELDNGNGGQWAKTDLAKKVANSLFSSIADHNPTPHVYSKADEFREFFKTYGIARTTLGTPRDPAKTRTLAASENGASIFAAEFGSKIFFLPFKALHQISSELVPLLTSAVGSILSYKLRNDVYLPEWVEEIRFNTENTLDEQISRLEEQLVELKGTSALWRSYKGILCASGRGLSETVVSVLRSFWGLNLQSEEAYIEDAMIYDEKGTPLFVVEIKGVNGGIKRDHINQVDSHRERLNLPEAVPGLLIINDFADEEGLQERKDKQIDRNHLDLALKQNVRVLRTTALLDLMLIAEQKEIPERTKTFFDVCNAGKPLVCATHG
ncbi:hypothetical protein ACXR0O_17655 [Verrucomicrobiota bacterium sgz303538]